MRPPIQTCLLAMLALLAACAQSAPPLATTTLVPPLTPTSVPAPTALRSHTTVTGRWLGGYLRASGAPMSLDVSIESVTQGTLTLEPQTKPRPLEQVQAQGDTVQFTITGAKPDGFNALHFAGQLSAGGQLIGEVDEDGTHYAVTLHALIEPSPVQADIYMGAYTFPSGRVLSILRAPHFTIGNLNGFAGSLVYTDFESGAMRGMYQISPDVFLVGGARGIGYPFAAQITFDRNGSTAVAGLIWHSLDPATGQFVGEAETGTRLTPVVEEVRYTSADGIALAGRLTLPSTPGPYPALVMLHGSERGIRNGFGQQLMGAFMASHGIALLTYDKRGVGDSGGTYAESASESNLARLAQDAVAGVNHLKGRSEIDSHHIGLIGGSQAGWIIPLAAAQSNEVAFFVILSGPVVSVGHEDLYSAYTNDGESPTQYTPEEISKQLATLPPSGFDPVPVMATLHQPGLWLWGDQDKSVPIPESVSNLTTLIAQGQADFTYVVFPEADHFLSQSSTGLLAEYPYSPGYPEDYYSTLAHWLQQHLK